MEGRNEKGLQKDCIKKARGQKGWTGKKRKHIIKPKGSALRAKVSTYQEDDHNADLLGDGGGPQENRQELGPGDASCAYYGKEHVHVVSTRTARHPRVGGKGKNGTQRKRNSDLCGTYRW